MENLKSDNKERVALDLMVIIANTDKKAATSIPQDAAKYYIHLYHGCLQVVKGMGTSPAIAAVANR
jgi:hypothetical protein